MFKHVTLYTNKLKQLRRFYVNMLEFTAIETSEDQFTITIGTSQLTFVQSAEDSFYQYAINIPGNQFTIIKDWVQTRYQLNKQGGINEIYKPRFDADAMFIEDPAGNLIQLIGRRNRDFFGAFTHDAFYNISEVTIVSPLVVEIGEQIQDTGIPLLSGIEADPEADNYLGKDDTFILLANTKRKIDFLERKLETHPLDITLNDGTQLALNKQGELTIS